MIPYLLYIEIWVSSRNQLKKKKNRTLEKECLRVFSRIPQSNQENQEFNDSSFHENPFCLDSSTIDSKNAQEKLLISSKISFEQYPDDKKFFSVQK
jgi:hypothetical protein